MDTCNVYDYNSLPINLSSLNNFTIRKMMSDEYLCSSLYNGDAQSLSILGCKNVYCIKKINIKTFSKDIYH